MGKVSVNYKFPEEDVEAIRRAAKAEGLNMTDFVIKAVRYYINTGTSNQVKDLALSISDPALRHPFAKLVKSKGIEVNKPSGGVLKIDSLTRLFDFMEREVFVAEPKISIVDIDESKNDIEDEV